MQKASLSDALFGKTKKAVIGLLFSRPDASVHLRELARLAGVSAPAMARELATLADAGIVVSRRDGNRVQYQANRDCPLFDELFGIARKISATGIVDAIEHVLKGADIELAFIFGSIAKGTERSDSDVDLLAVGDLDAIDLNDRLASAETELKRRIHLSHYGRKEWATARQDRLLKKILDDKKLMVIGNDPATGKL